MTGGTSSGTIVPPLSSDVVIVKGSKVKIGSEGGAATTTEDGTTGAGGGVNGGAGVTTTGAVTVGNTTVPEDFDGAPAQTGPISKNEPAAAQITDNARLCAAKLNSLLILIIIRSPW